MTPDAVPEQSGLGGRKPGNSGDADKGRTRGEDERKWKEKYTKEQFEAETSSGIA